MTLSEQSLRLIEEHLRHLMKKMGFDQVKIACTERTIDHAGPDITHQLRVDIQAGDGGKILIGTHGHHLQALQHITRSIIRKKLGHPLHVIVDVNGYLAGRERTLLHLAEEAARKAGRTGRPITLPPMAPAQRRTIHTSLAGRPDINTVSAGEEPNRRVVVRPIFI